MFVAALQPPPHDGKVERIARALSRRPGCAWLDGDGRFGELGRYSFLGSDPVEVRCVRFGEGSLGRALDGLDSAALDEDPGVGPPARNVPRWIGYLAHDATFLGYARRPPRLDRNPESTALWLGRYDALVAWDHVAGSAWLVGDSAEACEALRRRVDVATEPPTATATEVEVDTPERHLHAIGSALSHISAGDVYQVNLARRWEGRFAGDPLALWLAMRSASPVPLGLFLDAGDHTVLARTMETFLHWDRSNRRLASRPIKGTIARHGADADEARQLASDDKERAEHAMIVDLVRNDLSRVAETGTVRIEDVMAVEPYAKLAHLVSTVTCRTMPGTTVDDVLSATFPPGSVTGAPKLRAIEIIEALEPVPRGVYTGCVGHVDRAGGLRLAVAIRTAQIGGGRVSYHAGGGLVSASDPARELAETELKARVFLDALASLS